MASAKQALDRTSDGLPLHDPARSVFINCPFDADYEPRLDAILCTTVACGLIPRIATESGQTDIPRVERIVHGIFTSDYSIHDLYRYQGEGNDNAARFNMPLELGFAVSRQFVAKRLGIGVKPIKAAVRKSYADWFRNHHRWCALVPTTVDYGKFISDLKGYDPKAYDGSETGIINAVLSWYVSMGFTDGKFPTPGYLLEKLGVFRLRKEAARIEQKWTDLPWSVQIDLAVECVLAPPG